MNEAILVFKLSRTVLTQTPREIPQKYSDLVPHPKDSHYGRQRTGAQGSEGGSPQGIGEGWCTSGATSG